MISSKPLLIILLLGSVFGLNETLDVTAKPKTMPSTYADFGFQQLYNFSTIKSTSLMKGQQQLFFFRLFSYDGIASAIPPKRYTSSFGVFIDDYTELIIPNCNL